MNPTRSLFGVVVERSAVLLEARSNVGPIAFGTTAIEGQVEAAVNDSLVDVDSAPSACLSLKLDTLRSGNSLYDAELLRRVDARRHPTTSVELRGASRVGGSNRYLVDGIMTFHGISVSMSGTVGISLCDNGNLVVTGEHVFDIRDFGIAVPSVLMLKIYPDVRVQLQLEVQPVGVTT